MRRSYRHGTRRCDNSRTGSDYKVSLGKKKKNCALHFIRHFEMRFGLRVMKIIRTRSNNKREIIRVAKRLIIEIVSLIFTRLSVQSTFSC